MKVITLLSLFFTFSAATFASVEENKAILTKKILIVTYDKLSTTQKTEDIVRVKIERDMKVPYRPDVKGAKVEFYLEGKKIGQDITDNQGIAEANINPSELNLGLNFVDVRGPNNSAARLKVFVIDEIKPIFITDIDHTISDLESWRVPITSVHNTPTLPGAVSAVNELSKDFFIYYLTARDDAFMDKTNLWLKVKGFPEGPVTFSNYKINDRDSFNQGLHKQKVIREMKNTFKQILVGAGDKPHDVEAYRMFGLRAYFIGPTCPSDLAKGTICAKSWAEITDHLDQYPLGSLSTDPDTY